MVMVVVMKARDGWNKNRIEINLPHQGSFVEDEYLHDHQQIRELLEEKMERELVKDQGKVAQPD